MTQRFVEGALTFEFPDSWSICRPDQTSFYRRHFQSFCGGCHEVDFQAFDPGAMTIWLIEVKDYRVFRRTRLEELADEVAQKARDVLAMLFVAGIRDNTASTPQRVQAGDFWNRARAAIDIRVVLHCELPRSPSRLFPGIKDVANLQSKLKQKLRVIDPHALFTNRTMAHPLPWTVI